MEEPKSYIHDDGRKFYHMMKMESVMWTGPDSVRDNIKLNMARHLPELEYLPEYLQPKSEPLAIVGGGPTLKKTYTELKDFKNIIVAGSAHDWVIQHGIKPNYCLVLDPDPATCGYFKHPIKECNYLVASQCVPKLFDILKDYQVTVWHAATNIPPEEQAMIISGAGWTREQILKKPIIGGGCTTGIRCISLAMFLGFKELHLFGMDSNVEGDAHHAYDFADPENEWLGDIIEVNFGSKLHDEKSPTWVMARYMMLQLWSLSAFLDVYYPQNFSLEVHGESALKEFMRVREKNIQLLKEKAA